MPRRSTPVFQSVLFAIAFALPGCSPEERNFGTGGAGGQGNTGNAGGAGGMSTSSSGMPVPCSSPIECPKGGPCETPACTAGQCGLVLVVDNTSCSQEGHLCMNGQCVCPDGLVDCNGACVDTTSDGLNCGACGHDCLGGGCTTGVCEPVALATLQGSVDGIAVDADHVYWTRKGANRVMLIPKDGSSGAQPFATAQEAPTGIALSPTEVFWINEGTASPPALMKMAKAGGTEIKLQGSLKNPHRLGLDAQFVYWHEFTNLNGSIKKLDQAGMMAPVTLAQTPTSPQDIAVGGGYVYWSTSLLILQEEIKRVAVGGGIEQTLTTAVNKPTFLALDDSFVYISSAANGSISRVPLGGGMPETLAPGQGTQAAPHLALDKAYLYWTTGATVMRLPLAGGMPETLATGQSAAGEIAVDDTRVYWGTGDGKLMMRAK